MRTDSVSIACHKTHGTRGRQDLPREGTCLHLLYDFFLRNRGRDVAYSRAWQSSPKGLEQLLDFYGMDIRRTSKQRYCLFGEWFGHRYVDYTANPSTEAVPRDWREWQLNPSASSEAA